MLTDNHYSDMIIYSALISEYEKLDFKNDALAGVRANYFNYNNSPQTDKTDIQIDEKTYNFSYLLKSGEPLSWKITRNNTPFQTVVKATGGTYAVVSYTENGNIYKRQYFNACHFWTGTEYYDKNLSNVIVALIKPERISGYFAIRLETVDDFGKKTKKYLFPYAEAPNKKCSGLVYSNYGMLWLDESFKPEDLSVDEILTAQKTKGFNFKYENFSTGTNVVLPYDMDSADYLQIDDNSEEPVATEEPQENEQEYSAYDKIEKILFEAHKTNKDLFGEILNQTSYEKDEPVSAESIVLPQEPVENDVVEVTDDTFKNYVVEESDNAEENAASQDLDIQIQSDVADDTSNAEASEAVEEAIKVDEADSSQPDETDYDTCDSEFNVELEKEFPDTADELMSGESSEAPTAEIAEFDDEIEASFTKQELPDVDKIVSASDGDYSYFGNLNCENLRTGVGRTVSPNGLTSYEGGYKDDKRDGFGVCYYKSGSVNYVGDWQNGKRSGCGVGYRQTDGTLHAGKWLDNSPQSFGARFDKEGNFIDVCSYVKGVKNGKSVSFDKNGNVVISYWNDGELVSQRVITDEE